LSFEDPPYEVCKEAHAIAVLGRNGTSLSSNDLQSEFHDASLIYLGRNTWCGLAKDWDLYIMNWLYVHPGPSEGEGFAAHGAC
jgi:hypothetical protein